MIGDETEAVLFVTVGYEDGVYYVITSNIPGLNVEAESYEAFVAITKDLAPDLLGMSRLPTITFQKAPQTAS